MTLKRVYIEISNICNLHCSFCPPVKRKPQTMTAEEFLHIVRQAKQFTRYIYLHIKGEPLIHPQLFELLNIAQAEGMRVNLTTNGVLLPLYGDRLLAHPAIRQINISLHAYNELAQEKKEAYLNAVIQLTKAAERMGKYAVLRLWNLNEHNETNESSLFVMHEIEKSFGISTPLVEQMTSGGSVKLETRTYVDWDREFEWPSLQNEFVSKEGYCQGLRQQVGVLVDGTVVMCCLDANGEAPLGNIFEQSLYDILNSTRALNIRRGFGSRKCVEPLCRHCSFRTRFNLE